MQVLFDSSVYIGAFRGDRDAGLIFERWRRKAPIWVSSVVLEELYAGGLNRRAARKQNLEKNLISVNSFLSGSLKKAMSS